jgi:hypothetical protein
MTDNLLAAVTVDSFGAGIPTYDLALRIQHQDRVVPDFVKQHPILFFAVPERVLCKSASGGVALDAPTCGSGDQRAQNGSDDQNDFGLV